MGHVIILFSPSYYPPAKAELAVAALGARERAVAAVRHAARKRGRKHGRKRLRLVARAGVRKAVARKIATRVGLFRARLRRRTVGTIRV